ncbi:MAG: glycosyltransferase family 4 protein [Nocardioides sp.]
MAVLVGRPAGPRAGVRGHGLRPGATGPSREVEVAGPVASPACPPCTPATTCSWRPPGWETYGMVVTEALAHGLPVVASDVGGVAEALGRAPDGARPGALVAAGDPAALAGHCAARSPTPAGARTSAPPRSPAAPAGRLAGHGGSGAGRPAASRPGHRRRHR